jgi:hypothetical protein
MCKKAAGTEACGELSFFRRACVVVGTLRQASANSFPNFVDGYGATLAEAEEIMHLKCKRWPANPGCQVSASACDSLAGTYQQWVVDEVPPFLARNVVAIGALALLFLIGNFALFIFLIRRVKRPPAPEPFVSTRSKQPPLQRKPQHQAPFEI